MVHHVPKGHQPVTTYISVADPDAALAWYREVLDAKDKSRLSAPDGSIMHAEIVVEGSAILVNSANSVWGTMAPGELASYTLCVYVPDCDAVYARCMQAGATSISAPKDQFWGDRAGKIRDPFGVRWMIMTHQEDMSMDELDERFAAMLLNS